MRFFELVRSTPILHLSGADCEISSLVIDSREARAGSLFFCIPGVRIDRHALALDAYARGCRAFVAERTLSLPQDTSIVILPHARLALADMAAAFYGYPAEEMTAVGVTGTNGKSAVAWILFRLLTAAGLRVGYIGAFGAHAGGRWVTTCNTTPESAELQRILYEMREGGISHLVLEISSQSLAVGRVRGLSFPYAVLTGLAYGHVGHGEHANLTAYLDAKRELFRFHRVETLIYNGDDKNVLDFVSGLHERRVRVGFSAGSDYRIRSVSDSGKALAEASALFALRSANGVDPIRLCPTKDFGGSEAVLALAAAEELLRERGKGFSRAILLRTLAGVTLPKRSSAQRKAEGFEAAASLSALFSEASEKEKQRFAFFRKKVAKTANFFSKPY